IEHADRAGLPLLRAKLFDDTLRVPPPRLRGEVGVAELERFGKQPEITPDRLDVAELLKGEQKATGSCARKAGRRGRLGERTRGMALVETAHDHQPLLQRLDELGTPPLRTGRFVD